MDYVTTINDTATSFGKTDIRVHYKEEKVRLMSYGGVLIKPDFALVFADTKCTITHKKGVKLDRPEPNNAYNKIIKIPDSNHVIIATGTSIFGDNSDGTYIELKDIVKETYFESHYSYLLQFESKTKHSILKAPTKTAGCAYFCFGYAENGISLSRGEVGRLSRSLTEYEPTITNALFTTGADWATSNIKQINVDDIPNQVDPAIDWLIIHMQKMFKQSKQEDNSVGGYLDVAVIKKDEGIPNMKRIEI